MNTISIAADMIKSNEGPLLSQTNCRFTCGGVLFYPPVGIKIKIHFVPFLWIDGMPAFCSTGAGGRKENVADPWADRVVRPYRNVFDFPLLSFLPATSYPTVKEQLCR